MINNVTAIASSAFKLSWHSALLGYSARVLRVL